MLNFIFDTPYTNEVNERGDQNQLDKHVARFYFDFKIPSKAFKCKVHLFI